MQAAWFLCYFIATSGDNWIDGIHAATFQQYSWLDLTDLDSIIDVFTNNRQSDLKDW
jgi:hypothetical protein